MWPGSLKPNNLTNRGYCSVWKFPFSNQENTALSGLWLTDPFPPTAQQSATSEGLLLPPFPGNVRQLPSKAARKQKDAPSGIHRFMPGQVFFSAAKKLWSKSSGRGDTPNLAQTASPCSRWLRSARSPPFFTLYLVAKESAREVPAQWPQIGSCLPLWGGAPTRSPGSSAGTSQISFQSLRVPPTLWKPRSEEPCLNVPSRRTRLYSSCAVFCFCFFFLLGFFSSVYLPDHTWHVQNLIWFNKWSKIPI